MEETRKAKWRGCWNWDYKCVFVSKPIFASIFQLKRGRGVCGIFKQTVEYASLQAHAAVLFSLFTLLFQNLNVELLEMGK